MNKVLSVLAILLSCMAFCSCGGDDETVVTEFDNWQLRNDQWFETMYKQAKTAISGGDTSWDVIPAYGRPQQSTDFRDYIVVKKLGKETFPEMPSETDQYLSPMSTDSVKIHYSGRLMPTLTYADGLQFDSSWSGTFDPNRAMPYKSTAGSFIQGFSTALYNMTTGEHWRVYMHYSTAYNAQQAGSVLPFSALCFDIYLARFWHPRKVQYNAKAMK